MPWTGNPSTDPSDAIRAMVGDTDPAVPLLHDDVYILIIATEHGVYSRASMAATALAGKYAREMTKRVGDLWREAKVLYQHFEALAKWLRTEGSRRSPGKPYLGGSSVADVDAAESDSSLTQPNFKVGMIDSIDPVGTTEG